MHSQFRPGQSGNPKGRRKGVPNFATTMLEVLNQRIVVTQNGKSRRVPLQEAGLVKLIQQALSGSAPHLKLFIELLRHYNSEGPAMSSQLGPRDQELLDAYTADLTRQLEQAQKQQADQSGETSRNVRPLARYGWRNRTKGRE